MPKLYAEKIVKNQDVNLEPAESTFRLRFNLFEAEILEPHFIKLIPSMAEMVDHTFEKATEGIFTPKTFLADGIMEGEVVFGEDIQPTSDAEINSKNDYEVILLSEDFAAGESSATSNTQQETETIEEEVPKLPAVLTEEELTKKDRKTGKYPWAKSIEILGNTFSDSFVPLEKITFTVGDNWGSNNNSDRLSWIVYKDHDHNSPIFFYPDKGGTLEIDFSTLPAGKYRVEAFGQWSLWHAHHKKNRFKEPLVGKSTKLKDYAIINIESTLNRLKDINSSETGPHVAPGEDISFSTGALFDEPEAVKNLSWTLTDANNKTVMGDATKAATGKDEITLNFPKPGESEIQEYVLQVTSDSGLTTEKKIQVHFLKRLGKEDLIKKPETESIPSRPGASTIKIKSGSHSGHSVALKPITFKVSKPNPQDKELYSWILYNGFSYDYPIMIDFDKKPEHTVDFSKLPPGEYIVECFGNYSQWHANEGHNRFDEVLTAKQKKGPFATMKVESKPNVLENIKSADLVINDQESKKQETNWGIPVKFTADLLFDLEEDFASLEWKLKDMEGNAVMEEVTNAAKGMSEVVFNFPQPEKKKEYALRLSLNGVSKTQNFTVVPKAFVNAIKLESVTDRYVYNEKKNFTFEVSGFTQKQPNISDIEQTKWVRIFFPGLHYEDYKSDIKLSFAGKTVTGATMNGNTTKMVESFSGSNTLSISAGVFADAAQTSYKKGLYLVEAYTDTPDGKRSSRFNDMVYYELTVNEPRDIKGPVLMRPSEGTIKQGETFEYEITSWLVSEAPKESEKVNWALYSGDGVTKLKDFVEKGAIVELAYSATGNYVLKAWVTDISRGANMDIRIEKAKIVDTFFTDSSGMQIKNASYKDKIWIWMKTEGLAEEEVQVTFFDEDAMNDVCLQAAKTIIGNTGIIFQELQFDQEKIKKRTGGDSKIQVYPTLSLPVDSKIKLDHELIKRTMHHYYLSDTPLLTAHKDGNLSDFHFIDSRTNKVLTRPVLYDEKAKVRVRLMNNHEEKVYIYLGEYGTSTYVPLPESRVSLEINEEGFAEMEFAIPKSFDDPSKIKDKEIRHIYPFVLFSLTTLKVGILDNFTNKEKMLKLVREMPTEDEIGKMEWEEVKYAELDQERSKLDAIFPLAIEPLNDYRGKFGKDFFFLEGKKKNQTTFTANRSKGKRLHAAIDLYTPPLTPVFAIADGKVLNVSDFYLGTYEVTIEHELELEKGRKLIVRYGELDSGSILTESGKTVKKGDMIGKTGKLTNSDGTHLNVVPGEEIYMLHFELYTGEFGTNLGTAPLTQSGNNFKRRKDLADPEAFLRDLYETSFGTRYFLEVDAKEALGNILENYGEDMAITIERIYRWETGHFSSQQYLLTGTPGMEAHGPPPYYGWDSKNFSKHPDSKPVGIVPMYEGEGLSGEGGIQQDKEKAKKFIKMKSVTGAMVFLAEYINSHGGNYARWYSTDESNQEKYKSKLKKVTPKIVNSLKNES